MLPWGPVIPGSRRNLFKDQSFVDWDNAGTKGRQVACWQGAACKGRGGEGRWSAPGVVQCRGNEEMGNGCVCLPGA